MKIVVIGGTGLIGTKLVNNLREQGHEVVAASPSKGVNAVTGEGLAAALAGASVVVDVANAPSWEDQAVLDFFETSGRNLLAAEAAAKVGHHVALSVVGTDGLLASGYFRAKMAQENLIKAASIPYTIVRATQFFEFVGGIAQFSTEGQTVRLPPAMMRPIAAQDVAAAAGRHLNRKGEERHDRDCRPRIDPHGRTRATISGRQQRSPPGDHGSSGPVLRRCGERPQPGARATMRLPRPDGFDPLARFPVDGSGPLKRRGRLKRRCFKAVLVQRASCFKTCSALASKIRCHSGATSESQSSCA